MYLRAPQTAWQPREKPTM
uniref:Uncharacterized protein n=1 Tax=Arundo donax TaxID=35708 RepID=A0A0A9EKL9_ARUDO